MPMERMQKSINLDLRDVTCIASSKKLSRCRSFHFRYLELCRAKNITPLADIKSKNNCTSVLDFFGDKLAVTDWLLLLEALYNDQILQTLCIRTRKPFGSVLVHLDTEKKARLFRQKPVLYTKYIFAGLVESISNCIEFNKTLRVLHLEGLPLNDKYVESIAKALSSNKSLQEISFQRSNIGDKGCEAICNTIKYLENVEKLNLSDCDLTTRGAEFIADMVKVLKISRYTVGWQKSLRYRNVDPDSIPGLRCISIAHNPQIGDDGIKGIVEVLKEDAWIKVIDMENCGLTDRAANMILDCLEINNYIIDFNIRGNLGISKFLQRSIRDQLGKEDEDQKLLDNQEQEVVKGPNGTLIKRPKITINSLKEQIKSLEEQLAHERVLRKKAEHLSEKLNQQIVAYENQLENEMKANIPEGYVVVKDESLQSIIRERNDFQKLATSVVMSNETTPRNNINRSSQPADQSHGSTDEMEENDVPHNSPNTSSDQTTTQIDQRRLLKVRKVKSEVKYVDAVPKEVNKRTVSKSDHEFADESDTHRSSIQFESNIGDSMAINSSRSTNTVINTKTQMLITKEKNVNLIYNTNNSNNNSSSNNNNNNNNNEIKSTSNDNKNKNPYINLNKFDLDNISMPTARSSNSDVFSSDSDTIRNEMMDTTFQPMQVFIRRGKPTMPLTPMPKSPTDEHLEIMEKTRQNKGDGTNGTREKTPRSLFLGLCED